MSSLNPIALMAAKAAVLLLLTALVALTARRASAAIRHLIWSTGLASTLLLPLVPLAIPAWRALPEMNRAAASDALALVTDAADVAITVSSPAEAPSIGGDAAIASLASAPSASGGATLAASAPEPAETNWVDRIVWIWALGAAGVGAWLMAGVVGIRRLRRDAMPLESPEWIETVEEVLADRSFHRPLKFLESETVSTPCTWGTFRPVILLPTAGVEWPAIHRRHVVVHELAHVARFDCLTHLLGRVACAIHWFNPLVWIAARSSRMAREQACDDAVLNAGGLPSEYADLLLEAAQSGPEYPMPAAALAMARRSQLGDRLLAVLDPIRRRQGVDRGTVAAAGFGALSLLLPIGAATSKTNSAPAPDDVVIAAEAPVAPRPPRAVTIAAPAQDPDRCRSDGRGSEKTYRLSSSISITGEGSATDDDGNRMVVWTGTDCAVAIRSRGTPRFTDAEDDVAALPKGGRFEITFEQGRTERRYLVVERNGALERRYTIDGKPSEADPAALRWRPIAVLEFIRRTGFDAEARAARIWKTRGFDGLLREISLIESDGGKARYLEVGLQTPGVTAGQVTQLLAQTAIMESDGDQANVLATIPLSLLLEPGVSAGYLAAVREIDSDGDKTMVLTRLVRQRPSAATLGMILGLARTIDSDGDRTSLLAATIDAYPSPNTLPSEFYEAARGIESDGDLASLLSHALQSGKVDPRSREELVSLVDAIESDGDKSSVLIQVTELKDPTNALTAALLRSARRIDSDGDRASVLVQAAHRGLIRTDALRRAYLAAAEEISSDGDRQTALRAIGTRHVEQ